MENYRARKRVPDNVDKPNDAAAFIPSAKLGMWLFIIPIIMLFTAFTSAYLVRSNMGTWQSITMPGVLWINTVVLLLSSVTIQWAVRSVRKGNLTCLTIGFGITALLGILFFGGQIIAWHDLAASGIFVKSSPHSSFFYMLTGLHGVHFLGGLLFLLYVFAQTLRVRYSAEHHATVDLCTTYWHFLDVLWLYLFLLMFVFRTT